MATKTFGQVISESRKPYREERIHFQLQNIADSGYRAKDLGSNILDRGPLLRGRLISRDFGSLAGTETKITVLKALIKLKIS